jgi:RHS repeat-associated protein
MEKHGLLKQKTLHYFGLKIVSMVMILLFSAQIWAVEPNDDYQGIQDQWLRGLLLGKDMSDVAAGYAAMADTSKKIHGTQNSPLLQYKLAQDRFQTKLNRLLEKKGGFEQKHQMFFDDAYAELKTARLRLEKWFDQLTSHANKNEKFDSKHNRINDLRKNLDHQWAAITKASRQPINKWGTWVRKSFQFLGSGQTSNINEVDTDPIILRNDQLPFDNSNLTGPSLTYEPIVTPSYSDESYDLIVAEDLKSDEVVNLSPEIYELAESLEYDYIKIYNFVRQQIKEQYYAGSMKGSQGTLYSYAGNDVDQAALLMALLRASNIPSHFVQGVIEQPIDQVANGLGLSEASQVLEALNRAGIANEPVVQGGQIAAIRKQYTWVAAYIPYAHYRGSANNLIDPAWIPLAPAIKTTQLLPNDLNYASLDMNEDQLAFDYLIGSNSNEDLSPLSYWKEQLLAQYTGNYQELLTEVNNTSETMHVLPASLPFKVLATTYEGNTLPTSDLHHLHIKLQDDFQVLTDVALSLPAVAGKRITVSYLPATEEDLRIIYQSGGMSQVPPYLVDLRPVIKVDGRQVETNSAVIPMATLHDLKLQLLSPTGSVGVERKLLAGTYLSVVLGTQDDDYPLNSEETNLTDDETKPIRLIHNLGVNYHKLWNQAENELASVMDQAIIRPLPSISLLAPEFSVTESNGLPISMQFSSVSLDAISRTVDVVSRSGSLKSAWMRFAALQGSWLESAVFESQWVIPSISADQGIQTQAVNGESIHHITTDNVESVLPLINHPSSIKEHIQTWINRGFEVLVPENLLSQGIWQGSSWHIWHPESGASGYFISGGYAGGTTTQDPDEWVLDDLSALLSSPYAEGSNEDPYSGTKIVVVESTNNQVGEAGQQLDLPTQVLVTDAIGRPVVGAQVIFEVVSTITGSADSLSLLLSEEGLSHSVSVLTDANGTAEIDLILAKEIFPHQLRLLDVEDESVTRVGFANIKAIANSALGELSPDEPISHMIIPGPADHIEVIECYQYTDPCVPESLFGTMATVMHASVRDEFDNFVSNTPVVINLAPGTELTQAAKSDLQSKSLISVEVDVVGENVSTNDESTTKILGEMYPTYESAKVALVGECATEPSYLPPDCAVDHTSSEGLSYMSGPTWQTMNVYNGIPAELGQFGIDGYYEFPIEFTVQGLDPVTAKTYGRQNYENIFEPSILSFKDRYLFGPYGNYVTATPNQSLSIHAGLFRSMWSPNGEEYGITKMHEPTSGLNIYPYEIINEVLSGPATQEIIVNPDGFDFRLVEPGTEYGRTRYRTTFKTPDGFNGTEFEVAFNSFSDTAKIEISSVSPEELILDEQSYLTHPIRVQTSITPVEFRPLNLVLNLLEDGEVINSAVALHPPGNIYTFSLSSGIVLNPESTYELEVVMNVGNEYEVSSERTDLTDFSPPLIGSVSGSGASSGIGSSQNIGQIVNGQIISPISVSQEIDLANSLVCGYNHINVNIVNDSNVTINLEKYGLEGQLTGEVITVLSETLLTAGDHQIEVSPPQLGNHNYQIQMTADAIDSDNDEYVTGLLRSKFDIENSMPVGHAMVKGVDLADGSMVYSKQDISLQSPGVDLEFVRTYSSQARHNLGPLGYGWSYNFMSRVIVNDCGQVTVTGADGGSARFKIVGDEFVPLKGYHSSLVFNEDGSFDYYPKGGNRYHYTKMQNKVWWMDYIEDPNGNRITVELVRRNNAPIIRSVTDAVGRRLFFEYEVRDFGLYNSEVLVKVSGPGGIILTFDYDDIGNLISANREGDTTAELLGYSGDEFGPSRSLLLSLTDQATGAVRTWGYQNKSFEVPPAIGDIPDIASIEVTSITETDAGTTEFSYTSAIGYNSAATVTQNEQPSSYQLNSYGAATSITSPAGTRTFNWETGTDVLLMSETDENSRIRSFEYDEFGNVTEERLGELVSTYTYWSPNQFEPPYIKNRVKTYTNWRGHVTSYSYDIKGNKKSEELNQISVLYDYDSMGLLKNMTDGNGHVSTFTYDSRGYQKSVRNPEGDEVKYVWSVRGQKLSETDGNGNITTYTYDSSDRMKTKRLNNRLWTYTYENGGRNRTETDPRMHSTSYSYDTQGRLLETTNAKSDTFTYTYDLNGNKLSENDFGGHVTTFSYDAANRLRTKTEPLGKVTTYDYDNVGNVLMETTADRVTEYTYDPNRYFQTSIIRRSSTGDVTISRTVDGHGNVLTETDPNQNTTTYTYDPHDRLLTADGPMGSGKIITYDNNGNVKSEEVFNSTGNQITTKEYDKANRVSLVNLPEGGVLTFDYDGNGNVTSEIKPEGYQATYTYNDLNLPTSKTVDGNRWVMSYDLAGNLETETWPVTAGIGQSNSITYGYDELNRQISQTDAIGAISSKTYDANSNLKTVTDGNGNLTSYDYNELNQRTDETLLLGRSRSYTYTVFGELLTETGPNGTITHSIDQLGRKTASQGPDQYSMIYGYDANGNLTSQTDSRSITTTFKVNALNQTYEQKTGSFTMTMSHDTLGNLLSQTDYRGIVSEFTYDKENRQTSFTRAGQLQSSTTYNTAGLPITVNDANGNTTTHEYNNLYHKTRTQLPESQTIVYEPNVFGDVVFQNNPGPNDITRTFDARRRVKTETNGASEQSQYEYDLNNNRTAVIKPGGQRWEYGFDAANRMTSVKNVPENIETLYGYDAADNLATITDAESKVTTFTHDDRNRKESKIYPGGTDVVSYGYDENSNLKTISLPNGVGITYHYDDLNRQYQQDYSGTYGTATVTLTLDGNGNVEAVNEIIDGSSYNYTMSYDNLDRMKSKTDRYGNTFFYTYDANGNRKQFRDHDNKVTDYDYDKLNRLERLTQAGVGAFEWSYNSAGLTERIEYPNGSEANYTYDNANRIDVLTNKVLGVDTSVYDYDYDDNGNRIELIETNINNAQVITYGYDNADRLTSMVYPNSTTTFTLDKVGNRMFETITGTNPNTKTYGYNTRDQLETVTDTNGLDISYDYDAAGNQTEKVENGVTTLFDYTARQRVKTITIGGAPPVEYQYDYTGQRVNQLNTGVERRYLYDGLSLVAETNVIGNTLARYHYGSRYQMAETRNGVNSYYQVDSMGTNSVITNQDGSIQARYEYDAYGKVLAETGISEQPFGFTGYQKDDDTGLYYANARYYDSETGRFLREDPFEGDANTPPSLHKYLYAHANPTYHTDPTGKCSVRIFRCQMEMMRNDNNSERIDGILETYDQQRAERAKNSTVIPFIAGGVAFLGEGVVDTGVFVYDLFANVNGASTESSIRVGDAIGSAIDFWSNPIDNTFEGIMRTNQEIDALKKAGEHSKAAFLQGKLILGGGSSVVAGGYGATKLPGLAKIGKSSKQDAHIVTEGTDNKVELVDVESNTPESTPLLTHSKPTTLTLNQVKNLRGKERWQAGEQYIQELYGSEGQRHYHVPPQDGELAISGSGGRFVDAPVDVDNGVLANEVKTYQKWRTVNGAPQQNTVPLNEHIRQQINKDIWLRDNLDGFDPRWLFIDAPPSSELSRYLSRHNIIHIEY